MNNLELLYQTCFDKFGITKEQILSKKRLPEYVKCRELIIKYLFSLGYDVYFISSELKLHRTTIIHYLNRRDTNGIKIFKDLNFKPIERDFNIIDRIISYYDIQGELKEYLLDYKKKNNVD